MKTKVYSSISFAYGVVVNSVQKQLLSVRSAKKFEHARKHRHLVDTLSLFLQGDHELLAKSRGPLIGEVDRPSSKLNLIAACVCKHGYEIILVQC